MNLTDEEKAVYDLIANSPHRITQAQIAKHERYLGCLEKHEGHLNIGKRETTLRRIRSIIRNLRINKGALILSDKNGYWLLKDKSEAEEYVKRLEKSARAQAKSLMVTYHVVKKNLGIESDYLERLASTPTLSETSKAMQLTVKEAAKVLGGQRKKKKHEGDNSIIQGNILDL